MLELRFSIRAGRVQLSCDPLLADALQALRARFATAQSISLQSFDVELDDLLVNLYELTQWPSTDSDVIWEPALRELVEANVADAAVAAERLNDEALAYEGTPAALDGDWQAGLTWFQERDLEKLLQLRHGANFSVPGAGKTRVALAAFHSRRTAGEVARMLVVCPKSAFESWNDEVKLCFPAAPPDIAVFGDGSAEADLLMVNYERLPDGETSLLHWLRAQPTLLVLDEAHRMKAGPLGVWGSICLALGPYAARRLILTGTPAPNGARDLENLMAFVWPGQGRLTVQSATATGDLRSASLALRPLFVRTTKNELGLPEVDVVKRHVELPRIHRDLYQALLGQAAMESTAHSRDLEALGRVLLYLLMAATTPALLATGSSRYEPLPYRVPPLEPPTDSTLGELLRDLPLYELSPKYKEVAAIIADNAAQGRKTLVWSTFIRNLTSLAGLLSSYNPAVVHGGTEDRAGELEKFREDTSCFVLLSNPATLGEGVSLHHTCNDAVYVDRDFAAGRFLQSIDRIHRLGLPPDAKTRVTLLLASETIDELVEQRLAAKLQFMGRILDDPEVEELGDLSEEPSSTIGMDDSDVQAFLQYLRPGAPS
jgi:SNF2 family DNA or RNA helicase